MELSDHFLGYRRADGSAGSRNHVIVLAAMDSANPTVRRIAQMVPTVTPITTPYGRGQFGEDAEQTRRLLIGMASNPNVAACVVVSLEPVTARDLTTEIAKTGRPTYSVVIQESGDTLRAAYDGAAMAARFVREASTLRREPIPLSDLVIGMEDGGSDTTIGIASNPALGHVADRVVDAGGTVFIAETSEILGAEHILSKRAVSEQVALDLVGIVDAVEAEARRRGVDIRGANPVPDNIRGGLTTIEEKSLGGILKGGTRPLQSVVRYGDRAPSAGFHVMDTAAPAVESNTGLISGGCQLIAFTTGVGNSIGAPITPVVKICANPNTVASMAFSIDVDLSRVTLGTEPLDEAARRLDAALIDHLEGTLTAAEVLGEEEVAISRLGPTI